jgi:four helix bundle protein
MAGMTWPEEMKRRTKKFALDVVRFCRTLPHSIECNVYRYQMIKAGTSVGANYRATYRGRSDGEKKAKISIAIEEADECQYWFEILNELELGAATERKRLLKEADELTAIFVTARMNMG